MKGFLLEIGFVPLRHIIIHDCMVFDLGRERHLSVGNIGTPNEMLSICAVDESGQVSDVIILHNYDYDGYLTKEKITYLISFFTYKNA